MTHNLIPLWLSLKLATITTAILLVIGLPIAYWLSHTRAKVKVIVEACVALPLVLPPTVLGFYLLILLGANSPIGSIWNTIAGSTLAFSFSGLVIGSILYSLPFVVQPLQTAFTSIGKKLPETASTLGAMPLDRFFTVTLPLAKRGLITAIVLGFAHTIGEFGVVLMIGGNIPGKTQVLSIAIYNNVEQMKYHQANIISISLLAFSFLVLILLFFTNRKTKGHLF